MRGNAHCAEHRPCIFAPPANPRLAARPKSPWRLEIEVLVRDAAVNERLLLVARGGEHGARHPAEEAAKLADAKKATKAKRQAEEAKKVADAQKAANAKKAAPAIAKPAPKK